MKTPFDTVMRVQRREIDNMGVAINALETRLVAIERARAGHRDRMVEEAEAARADLVMPSFAYMERARAERRRLAHDSAIQGARLNQMRSIATEAYGAYRAVEVAAESYRDEAGKHLARAEQAGIDDLSAAAFLKTRRAARKDGLP